MSKGISAKYVSAWCNICVLLYILVKCPKNCDFANKIIADANFICNIEKHCLYLHCMRFKYRLSWFFATFFPTSLYRRLYLCSGDSSRIGIYAAWLAGLVDLKRRVL